MAKKKKSGKRSKNRGPGKGKHGPIYNPKKAGHDGRVPIEILKKRLVRLTRIVGERTGMRFKK